jgi:hypothetical protein
LSATVNSAAMSALAGRLGDDLTVEVAQLVGLPAVQHRPGPLDHALAGCDAEQRRQLHEPAAADDGVEPTGQEGEQAQHEDVAQRDVHPVLLLSRARRTVGP